MRAFVHEAELELGPDGDERAPGAAVTVALCGHWEHEPPCHVPHRSDVSTRGQGGLGLRVVCVCPPSDEERVRTGISAALAGGMLPVPGPDGRAGETRWTVLYEAPGAPSRDDEAAATRMAGGTLA